jgi:hypothetical protein
VIKVYLLKRIISPYTGPDLVLGCFTDFQQARDAREFYIQQYEANTKDDPWKGQAFHDVDLEKDVVVLNNIPTHEILPTTNQVIVVSSFREGFGQIVREIHAICGSGKAAQNSIERDRKRLHGEWPSFFSTQRIVINKLLSDEKDRTDFSVHAKSIEDLKKKKKYRAAEKMLLERIEKAENNNQLDGLGVPDWYYFELAKLYRRQKNYSKEIVFLEDCAKKFLETGEMHRILTARLRRAKELAAAKKAARK